MKMALADQKFQKIDLKQQKYMNSDYWQKFGFLTYLLTFKYRK